MVELRKYYDFVWTNSEGAKSLFIFLKSHYQTALLELSLNLFLNHLNVFLLEMVLLHYLTSTDKPPQELN